MRLASGGLVKTTVYSRFSAKIPASKRRHGTASGVILAPPRRAIAALWILP
jgi:hypothetical protein